MSKGKRYYAVARGFHPGIYNSWKKCKQEIDGFGGARFKGFSSLEEAQSFIDDFNNRQYKQVDSMDGFRHIIYTDGGFRSSVNLGAYAWSYYNSETGLIQSGKRAVPDTTNQIMELTALYSALNHYKNLSNDKLLIVSDSRYVINIFALQWVDSWVKNGWKRGKDPVKNQQIIKPLYELVKSFKDLSFMWVKGHSYTLGNNRVDLLVNQAMDEYLEQN